jgi:Tat protein secretion system quality control protein TatD with DNase activity
VIHQRGDCFEDTLKIFTPFAKRVRGVFHCFASDTTLCSASWTSVRS